MNSVSEASKHLIGCKRWCVVHLVPTVIFFFFLSQGQASRCEGGTPRNTFPADLLRLDSSQRSIIIKQQDCEQSRGGGEGQGWSGKSHN